MTDHAFKRCIPTCFEILELIVFPVSVASKFCALSSASAALSWAAVILLYQYRHSEITRYNIYISIYTCTLLPVLFVSPPLLLSLPAQLCSLHLWLWLSPLSLQPQPLPLSLQVPSLIVSMRGLPVRLPLSSVVNGSSCYLTRLQHLLHDSLTGPPLAVAGHTHHLPL